MHVQSFVQDLSKDFNILLFLSFQSHLRCVQVSEALSEHNPFAFYQHDTCSCEKSCSVPIRTAKNQRSGLGIHNCLHRCTFAGRCPARGLAALLCSIRPVFLEERNAPHKKYKAPWLASLSAGDQKTYRFIHVCCGALQDS